MNKELIRLKKLLLQANTPNKEQQIAEALRVVFESVGNNDVDVVGTNGMTLEQALKILNWEESPLSQWE